MTDCNMISSKYNILVDDGNMLVFNTLTRNIIAVHASKKERVKLALTENRLSELTDSEKKRFIALNMLVNKQENEASLAQFQYNRHVYNNTDLNLVIIPTMACNFRCAYCPQEHQGRSMELPTQKAIIKYIQRHVNTYKRIFIEWFGGEPLLRKNDVISIMKQIKEICDEHKILLISSMTTNGYELDVATLDRLVENGVRYYQISIDGNKETHNRTRPHIRDNDSFGVIIDNLQKIKIQARSRHFTIGVRINVSQENIEAIESMIDFYSENFSDDSRFQLMWQWVRDWGGNERNTEIRSHLKSSDEACKKFYDICIRRKLKCVDYLSCKSGLNICEACKLNGYVVNCDGKIYKCAMQIGKDKYEEQNHVGNLLENGSMELNYSKIAQWIVPKETDSSCTECVYYPMCMGFPCPLSANYNNTKFCLAYRGLTSFDIRNICLHHNVELI